MKTIFLAAIMLLFAALAFGQQEQKIERVTPDDVVVLDNGDSYQAEDPTVENWQENDSISVSGDNGTLTNHDQDNDEVDVIPDAGGDAGDEN